MALIAAMRAESTRLICPAPMPSVCPSPQKTMAFDLTNLATRQANSRSAQLRRASARVRVTRCSSAGDDVARVGRLHQQAAADALEVAARGRRARRRQRDLEHADVRLPADHRQRVVGVAGRDQHLDELLATRPRRVAASSGAVEGDDAAEGRHRVGRERLVVGLDAAIARDGDAAGIGVLDDHAARARRRSSRTPRRHRRRRCCCRRAPCPAAAGSAARLPGAGALVAIERRLLVRVLAVAQVLQLARPAG